MNRKISKLQMAGINLIKNLKVLISIRVPLETLPTNGKLKFGSNNDLRSNSSGNNNDNDNNEYKYS